MPGIIIKFVKKHRGTAFNILMLIAWTNFLLRPVSTVGWLLSFTSIITILVFVKLSFKLTGIEYVGTLQADKDYEEGPLKIALFFVIVSAYVFLLGLSAYYLNTSYPQHFK